MREQLSSHLVSPGRLDDRFVITALSVALVLGLAGEVLFNGADAGLNVPLWLALVVGGLFWTALISGARIEGRRIALLACALGLATSLAWRASGVLNGINITGAAALFGLAIALPPGSGVRRLGFFAFVFAIWVACFAVLLGALQLAPRTRQRSRLLIRFRGEAASLGRGLAIALPLLLLFGGLFVAADAVFEEMLRRALRIDLRGAGVHAIWVLGCAWISLGAIWGSLAMEPTSAPLIEVPANRRLRGIEIGIVLGSLAVLFAAFVLVQLRYLFGGEQLILSTVRMTYAEYARRGFVELVAVAGLLVPVLLMTDFWRMRSGRANRIYGILAFALILLTFVVMASAVQRLRIYQETYGLTELRFYSLAFMGVTGGALAWLIVTVLPGRSAAFLSGCLTLAIMAIVTLAAVNPDAIIASTNIARAAEGKRFDAGYLTSLGADAVPAIVRNFGLIPDSDRCEVGRELIERWAVSAEDWRSWNWGRHRAAAAVESNRPMLESACSVSKVEGQRSVHGSSRSVLLAYNPSVQATT